MKSPNEVVASDGGGDGTENMIMGAMSREIGGAVLDEKVQLGIVAGWLQKAVLGRAQLGSGRASFSSSKRRVMHRGNY